MKELRATVRELISRTPSVTSVRFSANERMNFVPGQFVQVVFDPAHPDNKELNKYLSLSCSPHREYLEVTKRLSNSLFSQRLKQLKPGDEVVLRGPMGACVFKDDMKKTGFLIGGIGITPVISIIEYACEKKLDADICLVYSNRTDEDIAFKKELDAWKTQNRNVHISYLVSDCPPKDNTCSYGVIDTDFVRSKVCDIDERIFFIFGPPRMVEAMRGVCIALGCPGQNVKVENFIGY